MKTKVSIYFNGNKVEGGPGAVLEPAGCGPDVADVEYVPVLKHIEVWVTLEETDKRLQTLLDLLAARNIRATVRRRDIYTEDELAAARLLIAEPDEDCHLFGGPRVGTSYDMADACPKCGAGARQTSALIIDGEDLPKLDGRRAASTPYRDLLVDERLAEQLESAGITGLSFSSVYARLEDKRQIKLKWRQMRAERVLSPFAPQTTGAHRFESCLACTRSGFATTIKLPTRLAYRARDVAEIDDVNLTWEWFGETDFDGDVSEALFPYPWLLVTPKVWRVFRDAGVTDFEWIPIRVVDE